MKKLLLSTAFVAGWIIISFAQPCLPEGITFTTQAQIDNFQSNYPGCTEIEGYVEINDDNSSITNLNGLIGLTSIGGDLEIGEYWQSNPALTDLTGLDNLTSIGGSLWIHQNDDLISLTGLDNLTSIGRGLSIVSNDSLTSLTGLESLTSIDTTLSIVNNDALTIVNNDALTSLVGLDNLTSIEGGLSINNNDGLTSLSGLENLTFIQGYLCIHGNNVLTSLTGLENITSIGENLRIDGNQNLSNCEAAGICNYLQAPNGMVEIYNNAPGCNNPPEIANACGNTMPCLPYGNYYLFTQVDIDNFQFNYPGCTEIEGNITIAGNDIINLQKLSVLTNIGGDLKIGGNSALTSLAGLNYITSIGGDLELNWNGPELTSLSGLDNIDAASIHGLSIRYNFSLSTCEVQSICNYLVSPNGIVEISYNAPGCSSQLEIEEACEALHCLPEGITFTNQIEIDSFQINYPGCIEIGGDVTINGLDITNLNGLNNLTVIEGDLLIGGNSGSNPELTSLAGLDNVIAIMGDLNIYNNDALITLSGLESLVSLEGKIDIRYNENLSNLSGIDNIDTALINELIIIYNNNLTSCHVQSICDYLTSAIAYVCIGFNAPGCDSQQEVEEACWTSVEKVGFENVFTISPNPIESTTLIEYTLLQNSPVTLKILDLSGREKVTLVNELRQQGEQKVVFNTAGLPAGVYFCVLKTNEGIQTKKIIKL